ncbi:MAG: NUDIX hydrolase [Blastocatellia bacterium]|nr:NUDIX hydrolase [Blastocatellia bacterium]
MKNLSRSYGGLVINPEGHILLVEPKNHFDGYVWTFPKGKAKPDLKPFESAQRVVQDKTGIFPLPLLKLPGEFAGGTSLTEFFVMNPFREITTKPNKENNSKWVPIEAVEPHISQTLNPVGRNRDLEVLARLFEVYPRILGGFRLDEQFETKENEVVTAYSLRFDGYAYAETGNNLEWQQNGSDSKVEWSKSFISNPDYSQSKDRLCMVLFFIQRGLIRERWLNWNSHTAQVARRLFLETYNYNVPEAVRYEGLYTTWSRKSESEREADAAFIRMRDYTTLYFPELRD